jgi:hypothetical protein
MDEPRCALTPGCGACRESFMEDSLTILRLKTVRRGISKVIRGIVIAAFVADA